MLARIPSFRPPFSPAEATIYHWGRMGRIQLNKRSVVLGFVSGSASNVFTPWKFHRAMLRKNNARALPKPD